MPEAGKVTVGLAWHWPCVMDSSGLSTYGLNGREWEMSTPPTPQLGHGCLYLFFNCIKSSHLYQVNTSSQRQHVIKLFVQPFFTIFIVCLCQIKYCKMHRKQQTKNAYIGVVGNGTSPQNSKNTAHTEQYLQT